MMLHLFRFVLAVAVPIFLGIFVASPVSAQESQISGRVTDEQGLPLASATVVLQTDGHPRRGAATDREGTFEFDNVEPGRYELIVSFVGYSSEARPVNAQSGRRVSVEIALRIQTLPQEEVVVTASRARRTLNPITFSNMTARELDEQPSMKDLPVLLSSLPSITHYSENGNGIGYSTMRMRGFDQRRLAVSINGIPQNDPEDFNVFWVNFFDLQGAVEDIQIQRGAGSSFYGPTAIGGAINMVAKPYVPYPYIEAEVGLGTYDTRRYTIEANTGTIGGEFVVFGRFSRLLTDGYRDWSWSEFYRYFVGAAWNGDNSSVTLQSYGGPQLDGLAFSGIPKAANEATIIDAFGTEVDRRYNFSSFTEDVEDFHQPHIELLHDWDVSTRTRLHQALFWVKGEGYFDFGGTFRSPEYLRLPESYRDLTEAERSLPLFIVAPDVQLLFRAYLDQWQVGWLPHVTIRHARGESTIGAEARLHRSLRWGRIQEASGIPEALVGEDDDVRVYSFRGEKVISSIYGRHLTRLGEILALQADVQITYRYYRVFDEAFFGTDFKKPYAFVNPRLGITLYPERPFSAYASVALAHREPRLKSLYDGEEAGAGFQPRFRRGSDGAFDYDEPLVDAERLVDFEVGAELNRPRIRAVVNGFWMEFENEIVPSGGLDQFGVPRTGNADRARHVGLELESTLRAAPWLDIFGNATFSRNRFIRFMEFVPGSDGQTTETVRDGKPIAGFPDRIGNLGAAVRKDGATLRIGLKYAGKQYIDNSGGILPDGLTSDNLVVDPYVLMNATLHYEPPFARGLRLALDVNNVLDQKVLLYGNVGPSGPQFFPTATRHVLFSVRYSLR